MKKVLLTLALFAGCSPAFASVGELFDKVVADPHFTILEEVTPCYYFDIVDKVHQGGAISSFYNVGGWLNATAGWVNSIEDTHQRGGALLGGEVRGGGLAKIFFPETYERIRGFLPESSLKFVDSLNVGFSFKHSFEKDAFTYGFITGIELRF